MDSDDENNEEVKICRNAIMTFVINCSSSKMPMKEKDLMTTIDRKGKIYSLAFQQAKTVLHEIYGLMLKTVPETKSGKAFICYNEDFAKSVLVYDKDQQREMTLLFIILSYLFMRNSDASGQHNTNEEQLVKFLNGLRIHLDMEHSFFGPNLKKLITETFVKQLYLKREKVTSELDTSINFYYTWGFRAHIEFDKKLVLESTAKILNKPSNAFVSKYQEVYDNEDVEME